MTVTTKKKKKEKPALDQEIKIQEKTVATMNKEDRKWN